MIEKSRDKAATVDNFVNWLQQTMILPFKNYIIASILVAFASAYLRVAKDGTERTCIRMLQEAAICGSLTLTISMGMNALIIYFEVNPAKASELIYSASIFIGGFVGNLGSSFVRQLARKIVRQKIEKGV